ncbi:conjugal transfer protein MobB [Capnocytophaga sp. ARDL2]|uniref:conjugal transfer protein MobB n=1 Tax=Capnocytophaga sp. ARDL2 TaxID=3238809 RepID=UPI003557B5E4
MVAKIHRGSNLLGVLLYNHNKLDKQEATILHTQNIIQPVNGNIGTSEIIRSFAPYLFANQKTEKPILHISLNPNPKDAVSDEVFVKVAQQYMHEMGWGKQPFVVYKHSDIEREHIHIVSLGIDESGKKINDSFEKIRSMKVCRNIENEFGLTPAIANKKGVELENDFELTQKENHLATLKVDYTQNEVKKQIASAVRQVIKNYQFQSFGEYTALLSRFNVGIEKVEGELQGTFKKGLVYFALDENGNKASQPFKASKMVKSLGLPFLERQFQKHLNFHKTQDTDFLKGEILNAQHSTQSTKDFVKMLNTKNIDVVIRKNTEGRLYGITFIDHNSQCVYNGSRLGKIFSANSFDLWEKQVESNKKQEIKNQGGKNQRIHSKEQKPSNQSIREESNNHFSIDFQCNESYQKDFGTDSALHSFLNLFSLDTQAVNYEEESFIRQMQRKRKKKSKRITS